uniref:Endophilin-B1 n=1 Tax=Cyprinus carpio carpio TaxID=630221 RepID=A0A9J8CLW4_CYPCA
MDFNVRKLATDAGIFFSRAVQFTEEKLGQAEKTELDAHFENLLSRADCTKNWTEKIYRQTEVVLQPNPGARIEEFLYEKLDRKVPPRPTNGEILGQFMLEAAKEFGSGTPYGSTLIKVGDCQRRLGGAEREFLQTSSISFLIPLRNFLEGDWRTISRERKLLENRRLDLDACKARVKKAKAAETKAGAVPDFQETRPRNYVLSASASASHFIPLCSAVIKHSLSLILLIIVMLSVLLSCHVFLFVSLSSDQLWNEELDKAEHELRVAQTEFDRQAEVTRLLLEGISSTHVNHLRCLCEFVEAQAMYYSQCHKYMLELQRELGSLLSFRRCPDSLDVNCHPASSPTDPSAFLPLNSPSPLETDALQIEEVQPPASGTRKAKVLYDYDAADSSELSLRADELITVYTVPGMDSDWLIGERGNQKGKVPVTYLELLS